MFLLLFSLTVADLPDLPGDDFEVDVPRTPFPTVAPTTPVATQPRKEDFNDITVTSTPNQIQKKLLYTFVALVCVALVGIIATVSFFIIKKRNSGRVTATEFDQEDESDNATKTATQTRDFNTTNSLNRTISSRKATPNTTLHTKSMYAVNTVIL
ncbi:hypothetical protein TVAG_390410 [Trichomonas vaginalis G3]|uniref:Uncharacterized protein n=1 Tax=Trichomonas vaginalis (strain ATCC PRA-98 / G3) TaxID=412133 RepID=A2ESU5_TRIV3|nr:hypothetical protein TVAGG3_0182030 [Trichomonas vaginalis G3]EAY04271.1 hypothetical protein TVAG_390410 [Trichomonas vaginalis G3]KAI5549364.1 hypothetical protein TVAGG3_0182030 [Trichomonas vaginalis G3]|eukprot:XP_001316494.1 hypothetical protein [Trichomonas vaginalis G3]